MIRYKFNEGRVDGTSIRARPGMVPSAGPLDPLGAQDVAKQLDRLLLARFCPPSVLIDYKLNIVQYRGDLSGFLGSAPGETNLLPMAHGDLFPTLREALAEVKMNAAPARRCAVVVDSHGTRCDLFILPFPNSTPELYVVLFELPENLQRIETQIGEEANHLARLERELAAGQARLAGLLEAHATQGEAFHKVNAELMRSASALDAVYFELKAVVLAAAQAEAVAERATKAKDQFLATLSHELRTPLSIMLMQAQLLRRGDMDASKLARASAAIERGTKMQVQLIDDLLDVTRISSGKLKLDLQPVNLRSVILAALENASWPAESKRVKIETALSAEEPQIYGDPTRLQQVVANLLTNAIKFTGEGGRVFVSLEMQAQCARLVIVDTGIGIDPEFLPKIFTRFTQEDSSSTRMFGGLGLGLAIVRHLIELHGGSVHAESPGLNKGATFSIVVPILDASVGTVQTGSQPLRTLPRASAYTALRGVRVLVVDDDGDTREAIAEMLAQTGVEVRVVASASACLSVAEWFKPEVLLSDIAMPGENGLSLIRRLRAGGSRVPAIALTAHASEDDRLQSLAAGFQQHLVKPVDIDRLSDTILKLLNPLVT
jgi:signal transduction histidine kinase